MIDKKEFPVAADDDGIRLDRWFKRHLEQVPHALLNKHLRKGDVRIDGKIREINTRVEKGQVITLPIFLLKSVPGAKTKEKVQKAYPPEEQKDMRRMVLFENKDCFVLNKPAELAVQGGSKVKDSLDDKLYLLSKGSDKPRLVHRLDRDTSGARYRCRQERHGGWRIDQSVCGSRSRKGLLGVDRRRSLAARGACQAAARQAVGRGRKRKWSSMRKRGRNRSRNSACLIPQQ